MASSAQDISPVVLEPTAPKEHDSEREETIHGEDASSTPPKDLRFWLIIMSLLVATFLSALDLTGGNLLFVSLCRPQKTDCRLYVEQPSVPHFLQSPML